MQTTRFPPAIRDRSWLATAVGVLALWLGLAVPVAAQSHAGWRRDITTMTRNLYFGTSLDDVMLAPSFPAVMQAVDAAWATVQATSFPDRAKVIADEIAAARPDLVGLQEVALWRVQSPGDLLLGGTTPATEVRYDFLQLLLDELALRGAPYRALVALDEIDAELPDTSGNDIRLTERDVIIARADLPRSVLHVLDTDAGHYATVLELPIGGPGGPVMPVRRGWVAADVLFRGAKLRFLNTHLEDAVALIQEAQAWEFLTGPAAVDMRVLAVGDFNSDALTNSTQTCGMLLAAGFTDAWASTCPGEPGATWGHAPDLLNPVPTLTERLDLVMFRGRIDALDAWLVGDQLADRTATVPPLWPSDHAGVVSVLRIRAWPWDSWVPPGFRGED
jgi:endonuclease/exonuclease/phosphatase family metal-dependent hydrolase